MDAVMLAWFAIFENDTSVGNGCIARISDADPISPIQQDPSSYHPFRHHREVRLAVPQEYDFEITGQLCWLRLKRIGKI